MPATSREPIVEELALPSAAQPPPAPVDVGVPSTLYMDAAKEFLGGQ